MFQKVKEDIKIKGDADHSTTTPQSSTSSFLFVYTPLEMFQFLPI